MPETLATRPEARFARVAGIAGGLVAAALSASEILSSSGSTAALGFVFVPLLAALVAVPAGIWGLALGCVWLSLRGRQRYFRAVLLTAWFVTLAAPAALGWHVWHALAQR